MKNSLRKLLTPVDWLLDRVTSYRLVLYVLLTTLTSAIIAAAFGKLPFEWHEILISAVWIVAISRGVNVLLSRYLNVPRNKESDLITALILALILSPPSSFSDFLILAAAAGIATVTKYILVINRWHIFNPAAAGAFAAGLIFNYYASWWIGTAILTPIVILSGWLILRKMKRYLMASVFIALYLVILAFNVYLNQSISAIDNNLWIALISSPLLFFSYVMLTEPLTSPRHKKAYIPYAVLIAILYGHPTLKLSPEEALLIGNLFAYLIEPHRRIELKFLRKVREAEGIESFLFSGKSGLKYQAGQYMEWTVEQNNSDSRGNRRYFTLSSSPTEKELMLTVRMPNPSSAFKRNLENLKKGNTVLASQLSGSFTLPKSEKQKLAFIAGGVGITPFRSMSKYIIDMQHERPVHLLYAASKPEEFAFRDLFAEAKKNGLETTYKVGLVDKDTLKQSIPDYKERTFYISGPYGFVRAIENALSSLGVPSKQVIVDYFPGYGG